MAKLVIQPELRDKNNWNLKLKNMIRTLTFDLKTKVIFTLFDAIIYQLNIAIKIRSKLQVYVTRKI